MKIEDILRRCDHTLLDRCATEEDIATTLLDAQRFGCASACIPPYYVGFAKKMMGDKIKICTVIGFPNGYSTEQAKLAEAREALENGADEIDTVINVGALKSGRHEEILHELCALKELCGKKILKVIIEACLLTEEEKIAAAGIVSASGADYIKTSTGFSHGGATFSDVELLRKNVKEGVKVKAAGGISTLEDAEKFIELGADRLGTSRIVKIAKGLSPDGKY